MELVPFLTTVGERIVKAGDVGDYAEALRLLHVLRDAIDDAIRNVEQRRDAGDRS